MPPPTLLFAPSIVIFVPVPFCIVKPSNNAAEVSSPTKVTTEALSEFEGELPSIIVCAT